MVDVNKQFMKELGERIAVKRKQLGITQVEMAEQFNCSQSTITAYENGTRRIPVSFLPQLADTLEMTLDELLAHKFKKPPKAKPGPPSKIEQQIEGLRRLPKRERELVMRMLDTVLVKV